MTSALDGSVSVTDAVVGRSVTSEISPKKSPAAERVDLAALAAHLGLAVEQDEELAAGVAFADQLLARGQVDLVGDLRDLLHPALGAAGEQRHAVEDVDLARPGSASATAQCAPIVTP